MIVDGKRYLPKKSLKVAELDGTSLYQTKFKTWFLCKDIGTITPLSLLEAVDWVKENFTDEEFTTIFGKEFIDTGRRHSCTFVLTEELLESLNQKAEESGIENNRSFLVRKAILENQPTLNDLKAFDDVGTKKNIRVVLSEEIINILDEASMKTGSSKSRLIRKVLSQAGY